MQFDRVLTGQRQVFQSGHSHVVRRVARPTRTLYRGRSISPSCRAAASTQSQDEAAKVGDDNALFVATNNFKVKAEHCEDFENVWRKRETHLKEFSGFIRFALLRCDDAGEYRSESFWENRKAFDNWRKSEQFTKSHREVGAKEGGEQSPKLSTMDMLAGRPQPKFYEAVTVTE